MMRRIGLGCLLIGITLLAPAWAHAACCACMDFDTQLPCPTDQQVCFSGVSFDDCQDLCQQFGCNDYFQSDPATCGVGAFDACVSIDPSTPTPASTPTTTPSAVPTTTPAAQGGACTVAAQCLPGLFCSDGVCCDTVCTGPGERCDVPGQVGTCIVAPAEAPAASSRTLAVMLATLLLAAFVALRRSLPLKR